MEKSINVFLAYAHEDDLLREQLRKRLSLLRRLGLIHVWYDGDIGAGTEWQEAIKSHLDTAHLILLLISPDFIDSDYCYSVEMMRALERHDAKEARVIPIILRPVRWKNTPFGKLQALPTKGEPVTSRSWYTQDEALFTVAEGIEKAVNELLAVEWYREADVLYNAKRFEEVLTALERAIQLDPDNARFYRSKGDSLWKLGRYEEALEAFEQALQRDPKDAVAYNNKGWVLNDLKRHNEALSACEQSIRLDSQQAIAYQNKGWALFELQRYEEAANAYLQAIDRDPDNAKPYESRGWVLYLLGRYEEALESYKQALQRAPESASWYEGEGLALYSLNRYEDALAAFEQARRLGYHSAKMYYHQGNALYHLARYETAVTAYKQALRLEQGSAETHYGLGNALYHLRQYEEAVAAYQEAIRLKADFAVAHYDLGNAFYHLQRYEEAVAAYRQSINLGFNTFAAHYDLGNALYHLQRYEEALAAYKRANELDHTQGVAHYDKGNALFHLQRYDEALIAYDQAIERGFTDAIVYYDRGSTLSRLQRYEEAAIAYEQALRLAPQNVGWYEEQGTVLCELGRYEEALGTNQQALQLDPAHAKWYNRQGIILRKLKRLGEALAAHEQALALSPKSHHLYTEKGVTLRDLERYEEAIASFEQALQLNPQSANAHNERGMAYRAVERYEKALADFDAALALAPDYDHAYKEKGITLYDCGDYESALAAFEQATRLTPGYAEAYAWMGRSLYLLQRYEEALVAYERARGLGCDPPDPSYAIVRGLHALGATQVSPFEHGSTQDGRGQYWHYPEMSVFWSPEGGIHAVRGPIRDKWESLDWEHGILGYPTTDTQELPDGVGQHCHFQHGCIYWSSETGAHEVHGLIRDKWASLGWERSFLGYPVADEKGSPDGIGRISNFQHGSIYWTPQTEAYAVFGEMRDKWESLRWELGPLGYPIGDQEPTADNIGRYQHFQGGSIYWFPETGTHAVHGLIRDKWESLDWEHGILGYPTTDIEGLPDEVGYHCHFQHGCIYWSSETGAHEVHGLIRDKWASLGWEHGILGYPIADQKDSPDGIGQISTFQRGAIYYTPETGAYELHGPIFEKWASLRWERGILRYPTSDQEPTKDGIGCYQHFQKGSIYWSPETGAQEVYGAIWARWKKIGWERSVLGYPTTGEMGAADGAGRYSHFQHGSIYYHGGADVSAHEVHGVIREKWGSLGWEQSFLGYPLTDERGAPDGIGRIGYFQHGAIYLSDATEAVVLEGPGKALLERFTSAEAFALALEQARKPLPTVLSVVIYHIDHHPEKNCGYYRIGRNLDANGVAADGWSKPVPRGLMATEHQGAGIALADLDGSGRLDLLIFRIDHSEQKDRGYYRVGRNLDAQGTAAGGWPEAIHVPDPFGKHNLGAGIAIADLNRSGRPDLLLFCLERREGENRGFYRVGRDIDSDKLEPSTWGERLQVPGDFSSEQYCTGIALADLDGSGRPDLIVFYIEHQEGENRGYYRIGKHLDSDGVVIGGWSESIPVPGSFGRQNHGASLAIADLNRNGRSDLVIFYIEHPEGGGENSGYYRIGKNLDANGYAVGGWSEPLQVPGWFGTMNQGAGIAFTTLL